MEPSSSLPNQTTKRAPVEGDWVPNPGPQSRFLSLTCFEALYGGAAGGGKSDALLIDAIRNVGRGYGRNYRALLLRRTFPELEMSLIDRSFALYPWLGGQYKLSTRTWHFPAGEIVRFGHAEGERDIENYQGAPFQYVAFDELTSFLRSQYTYMFTRCRSAHGVPCRIRGATNPGGDGHDWVFERFGYWLNPEAPVRAKPGEVLYFTKPEETDILVPKGTEKALSRVFVPAKLADNPYLAADGAYERSLYEEGPVRRAQLKDGNWLIKPGKGLYFKREWFNFVDQAPAAAVRVRYWDRASTEKTKDNDPDWTVGLMLAIAPDDRLYIEDVVRFRAGPGEVERTIKATAEMDGPDIPVHFSLDPGQAGKVEAYHYATSMQGFVTQATRESGDKVVRAGPISSQVNALNVSIVRGPWNNEFIRELEQFPEGTHDDQVDGLSGAYASLLLMGDRNPRLIKGRTSTR